MGHHSWPGDRTEGRQGHTPSESPCPGMHCFRCSLMLRGSGSTSPCQGGGGQPSSHGNSSSSCPSWLIRAQGYGLGKLGAGTEVKRIWPSLGLPPQTTQFENQEPSDQRDLKWDWGHQEPHPNYRRSRKDKGSLLTLPPHACPGSQAHSQQGRHQAAEQEPPCKIGLMVRFCRCRN